jgi:hypothetical protein
MSSNEEVKTVNGWVNGLAEAFYDTGTQKLK